MKSYKWENRPNLLFFCVSTCDSSDMYYIHWQIIVVSPKDNIAPKQREQIASWTNGVVREIENGFTEARRQIVIDREKLETCLRVENKWIATFDEWTLSKMILWLWPVMHIRVMLENQVYGRNPTYKRKLRDKYYFFSQKITSFDLLTLLSSRMEQLQKR